MPKTYYCLGSLVAHERASQLVDALRTRPGEDYAVLVNYQRTETLPGFSRIYNALLDAAFTDPECELAWVLGDDILPSTRRDTFKPVEDFMHASPDVGVAGPIEAWSKPLPSPTSVTNVELLKWVSIAPGGWVSIAPGDTKEVLVSDLFSDTPIDWLYIGFACACIRRKAWLAVGPMDESLGKGYCEDLDWGIRCWQNGYRCVSVRSAWYKHLRGATYNALKEQGRFREQEPYEAADRVKLKWPWLWNGETPEATLARMQDWYRGARNGSL